MWVLRLWLAGLLLAAGPAQAQFASGFDKAQAEAAFPLASASHIRDLRDLYAKRGVSAPAMQIRTTAQVASFLERRDGSAPYPDNSAVLLFDHRDAVLSAWLIDRSGLIAAARTPVSREQLDAAIRDLRLSLNVDGISRSRVARPRSAVEDRVEKRNALERDTNALSRMLLPKPLVAGLAKTQHLLVIANGAIATVPLAMLQLDRKDRLIDRMTVSVAPGLFDVDQMVAPWRAPEAFRTALIVGNPAVAPSPNWIVPDLPGAGAEAAAFAQLANRPALLGAEARKDVVLARMASAGMLYFAAHGVSNPDDPLRGGFLMLSGDDAESGFLRAGEVQTRRLRAQLAVLSACQSGLGLVHDGGVISLSRSFQKAGVPRVVMSLWSVSDEATETLMGHFQRALLNDAPASALRTAMLATRKTYPEPSLWASFVMFGTPR